MAIQLCAVGESVAADLAGKALLVLLVPVLDVLLEGSKPLVATVAVRAGQQLGEVIWRPECEICPKPRDQNIMPETLVLACSMFVYFEMGKNLYIKEDF